MDQRPAGSVVAPVAAHMATLAEVHFWSEQINNHSYHFLKYSLHLAAAVLVIIMVEKLLLNQRWSSD